jgi:hypothetical protein
MAAKPSLSRPLLWETKGSNKCGRISSGTPEPGPETAYNVKLVTATINGSPGALSPSGNVGDLAAGQSKTIMVTSGAMLNLGENIEVNTVTWTGGTSTLTIHYVARAGP